MAERITFPALDDIDPSAALDAALSAGKESAARLGGKTGSGTRSGTTGASSGTRATTPGKPAAAGKRPSLKQPLLDLYSMAGFTATMALRNKPRIGEQILLNADACAESVNKLAMENPKVYAAIERLLAASAMTGIITAHVPIIIAIMAETVPVLNEPLSAYLDDQQESAAKNAA